MPKVKVGGKVKEFAYTPKGMAMAKKEAKAMGKPMMMKKPQSKKK